MYAYAAKMELIHAEVIIFTNYLTNSGSKKLIFVTAAMVPIHASFGLVTFMLACATALTGLTQKAIWTLGYV